ncbi:MAG: hypothetical protein K8L99_33835 [Anaerolineae bacterium]|nr:hypothetical protein [Anaerolineae bacterium]
MKNLSMLFLISLLLIVLLGGASLVLAQDETAEPTAEVTAEPTVTPEPTAEVTPEPLPLPDEIDLSPDIGQFNGSVGDFLSGAVIALNFIAFLLIHTLKWAIPGNDIKTETIYQFVVITAAVIYGLAVMGGVVTQLQSGVNFLNAIAEPLANIILLLIGPAVTYRVAKAAKAPALGDHQGDKAFSLQRAA